SLGALRRTFLALSATPHRRPQTANAAALQTQARACRGYSGGSGKYRMTMPGHAAPVVPAKRVISSSNNVRGKPRGIKMLMVSTYLAPSAIEGIGVFAGEFIERGRLMWSLNPKFDIFVHVSELDSLPLHMQDYVARYTYPHLEMPGVIIL